MGLKGGKGQQIPLSSPWGDVIVCCCFTASLSHFLIIQSVFPFTDPSLGSSSQGQGQQSCLPLAELPPAPGEGMGYSPCIPKVPQWC